MRRALLPAALVLLAAAPQPRLFIQPNLRTPSAHGLSGSTFSWSLPPPAAACDCSTDPRLTVTSGATYCVKGNEWSGIQPGDLVSCAANKPRWMPGGDGTGPIGLQIWNGNTNQVTRSQDFTHADWSKHQVNGGTVTVTANACLAPDGTMTADMVHFSAATSGSKVAALYQQSCSIAPNVRTIYARTVNPDAGLSADDGGVLTGRFMFLKGNGSNFGSYCDHTSSGYTRCRQFDDAGSQIGAYFYFGHISDFDSFPDEYVCVWQADCQDNIETLQNPWPPPIATTSAAVTRAGDVIEANAFYYPQWSNANLSATVLDEAGASANNYKVLFDLNEHALSSSQVQLRKSVDDTRSQCQACGSANCIVAESTTQIASSADLLQCSYNGSNDYTACINNGGCGDAGIDAGEGPQPQLTLGSSWNGSDYINPLNGVLTSVSIGESARKDIYFFGDEVGKAHTTSSMADTPVYSQYLMHYNVSPVSGFGNNVNVFNRGDITGLSSAHCLTTVLSQLNYVVDAGLQSRSYFLLECGLDSAADAGGVIGDLQAAVASTQDAGVHMLWSTITPYFTQRTQIEAINSAMTSWCAGIGVPVANTYSDMESPAGSGHLNPAYDSGDTKHLNGAGYAEQTNVWIAKGLWTP